MASTVSIGLLSSAHDSVKVNVAGFTDVTLTGTINAPAATNSLDAPSGVAVTQGTGTALAISWQAVAGASGYVIERSADGVGFADVGTVASSATSWTDASLPVSMRFFYRVRATDESGRSAASAIVNAISRPIAVTNAAVTALTTSQLVLNWRDTSGDSGYRIERSTDGVTFTQVATVGTNVPSYAASGLAVGTNYWFRITPMTAYGDSVSTVISGSTRLQAVSGLAFTSKTSSALAIQWTALSSATGYRIERSTDGTTYSTLARVGNVTSYSDTTVSPLGKYYYRVIATNATAEGTNPLLPIYAGVPAATALPTPWTSVDIGNVPGTGAAGFSSGTFTVVSCGADIWSTADAFRYTYQPLVGDGSIVARVASVDSTGGWAKIGVMIRESVAANSRQAMMVVSPSNSVAMQYRSSTGGSSTSIAGPTGLAAPYWVKLARAGSVLTGSVSADGATWTQVGSVTISMASSVLVGLSANSNSSLLLNKATFTNVTVSNTAPTVAIAAAASPTTLTGNTTTLSVSGADDHGESSLAYTWSATGPAAVAFSATGTNAAKSSVATFAKAGAYTLTATITDAGGLTVSSAVNVTVAQTLTGVVVTPAVATVTAGATQQFVATATDQFGNPLAIQPPFTWSATGDGTITAGGLFTAPASGATSTVSVSTPGTSAPGTAASPITGSAVVTTTVDEVVAIAAGQTTTDAGGRTGSGAVIKRGDGVLVLNGSNTHSGGTIVEAGELVIRDVAALGSGRLEVWAGARVTLNVGFGEVVLSALMMDPLGRIEFGTGRLSIAAAGIAEVAVRQMLILGRNDGAWDGMAGFSSRAAGPGRGRALGYVATAYAITIAYAAAGDGNLDGIVDLLDVSGMTAGLDSIEPSGAAWYSGDYNYDALVDDLDRCDFLATGLFDQGSYLTASEAAFATFGAE
jgi:autotransporter-associated beta strand protein